MRERRLFAGAMVLIAIQFLSAAGMVLTPAFPSLLKFGTQPIPEEIETSSESKDALQSRTRRASAVAFYFRHRVGDRIAIACRLNAPQASWHSYSRTALHLIGSGIRILC